MPSVRETPPLRLSVLLTTPSGQCYRWAADEPKAENTPSGIHFSTGVPGGFTDFDCELPRKTAQGYQDLERLSNVCVLGAGGEIAWEGRLERTPRQSGEQVSVAPQAVGYQAHLDDDQSAREIYVDQSLQSWSTTSTQRKINLTIQNLAQFDSSVGPDTSTGAPALREALTGAWATAGGGISEALYDGGAGVSIGSIYYAWKRGPNMTAGPDGWVWQVLAATDDIATTSNASGDLQAAGPGSGTLSTSGASKRFGIVQLTFNVGAGVEGTDYDVYWTCLAVYGNHGLTKQGTASATSAQGFYASDVIANAISRWAPLLSYTTGQNGTIQPTSFVIPQLVFRDPTAASNIISEANRFHLNDWAVWEGQRIGNPTFYYGPRNTAAAVPRKWRARVAPAELQETGPQVDRVWNGVIVTWQDVSGVTKSVGPTGSLADTTDATLLDTDPLNPANQKGIKRYVVLEMGIVSTLAGATQVGALFLAQSKLLDTSGSAKLVGTVEDDKGVTHPAWQVRAGDQISFVDSSDTSYRRIVKTDYDHDSRTNSLDLDAPPEGLDDLLERLAVAVASFPLGAPAPGKTLHSGIHALAGGD